MKTKLLSLMLLAVILSLSMISAAAITDVKLSLSGDLTKNTDEVTLKIKNTHASDSINLTLSTISNIEVDGVTLDINQNVTGDILLGPNSEREVLISYILPSNIDLGDLGLGTFSTDIEVINKNIPSEKITETLNFISEFCDQGCAGDELSVDVSFDVIEGFGDEDENEWYPLDEIQVEVGVENDYEGTIDDIVVEWCLYNPDTDKCIIDNEEDNFRLKEDKDKKVLINFQLDPEDLDEGKDDYTFYVKVYSEDSNYGEDKLCIEDSQEITVMKDDSFVILDKIEIAEIIPCGVDLDISAEVWNIGEEDEKDVYIMIYNKELGLNQEVIVGDIDSLESEKISATIPIPMDAEEKQYDLAFRVLDEYDDIFENDNEDQAEFIRRIKVEGNCKTKTAELIEPQITAELDPETPEAIAGKQVIIKATLKNTGEDKTTYTISVSGNSAWSTLSAIDPQEITLETGESEEFSIVLDLDSDAEGEKEFKIKATYNEQTTEQEVLLSIKKPTAGITGSVIGEHIKSNWFVYLIAVINIILIIAIIAVVKSMATSKTPAR